ncbi:MAG: segregation/condensation protein A [Rhodocyclaceae bacterium]|jgi:segregation and condensation protein A|nr:segregation/condensation protein A [Rhodocyclaceae bacterium]
MNDTLELAPVETAAQAAAVARLYGEPMRDLPADLYIPPDALEVMLEAFEGPLDLLLYLIRRSSVDILDIPMAPLTAQYLAYVELMRSRNLELAADYLLMAAMLLEIKSRMLLPRPQREADAEPADPRAELVRRLLDYEQMKLAAVRIDAMPHAGRDQEWVGVMVAGRLVERLPDVSLHDLQLAWLKIVRRARLQRHHTVRRDELSVREHMSGILRRLAGGAHVAFEQLFDPRLGLAGVVVSFLAVLELVKERIIEITQNEAFAPLYARLADGTEDAG